MPGAAQLRVITGHIGIISFAMLVMLSQYQKAHGHDLLPDWINVPVAWAFFLGLPAYLWFRWRDSRAPKKQTPCTSCGMASGPLRRSFLGFGKLHCGSCCPGSARM